MFVFDRPLCIPFNAMRLVDHPVVDFIAVNHSKPGRGDLASYVVHARADWSARQLEDAPDVIAEQLVQALTAFSDDAPNLIYSVAHRWRFARVEVQDGIGCGFDEAAGIGLCGDYLSGPRVESAWISGHQLGLRMTGMAGKSKTQVQNAGRE